MFTAILRIICNNEMVIDLTLINWAWAEYGENRDSRKNMTGWWQNTKFRDIMDDRSMDMNKWINVKVQENSD